MYSCAAFSTQVRSASSAVVPAGRSRSRRSNSTIAVSYFGKTASSLDGK
jgi:hypothetical protein